MTQAAGDPDRSLQNCDFARVGQARMTVFSVRVAAVRPTETTLVAERHFGLIGSRWSTEPKQAEFI